MQDEEGSKITTSPVDKSLELFERDKDEHRRGLETRPGRHPALEHEHRALILHRGADHLHRRLSPPARSAHDTTLHYIQSVPSST